MPNPLLPCRGDGGYGIVREGMTTAARQMGPRFLADSMLGRLAKWLRLLGYDTVYFAQGEDSLLLQLAWREGRVLLTRDTRMLNRRAVPPMVFIRHDRVLDQVRQVTTALTLPIDERVGSRCLQCNVVLRRVGREEVTGQVPPYVLAQHETFSHCTACGRTYWPGTHWQAMEAQVRRLCD